MPKTKVYICRIITARPWGQYQVRYEMRAIKRLPMMAPVSVRAIASFQEGKEIAKKQGLKPVFFREFNDESIIGQVYYGPTEEIRR